MDITAFRDRQSEQKPMSVGELNGLIKNLLENSALLSDITVTGEISNFKFHSSGHFYFSIKDENGQISCVMFRSYAGLVKFLPKDGMKVVLHGSVSFYPKSGACQIYVTSMQQEGVGDLYVAYEKLKAKLDAEGLFNPSHKKPLPKMPQTVGVITSPTGAAVRDIIHVTGRRFPLAKIVLYPALVQGDEAEKSLISALDYFERTKSCDVIIIGRGGGSIEDLWAFNGEELARKIFGMSIPVISAVGHETDFTICDFISDMRAPTPSAAAEISVPDIRDILQFIDEYRYKATEKIQNLLKYYKEKLDGFIKRPYFLHPESLFEIPEITLDSLLRRANTGIDSTLVGFENALGLLSAKANAISPLSVLGRGYSIAQKDGGVISSVDDVKVDEGFTLILKDGKIGAVAKSITK